MNFKIIDPLTGTCCGTIIAFAVSQIIPVEMNAESLAFPDNTFDTVATVCVFCTVPHPVPGLEECRRVLKPGRKLLMFEHVMSKNLIYGLSLRFMSLFTNALEGTHLDRDTVENVRKAGFTIQAEKMSIWTS